MRMVVEPSLPVQIAEARTGMDTTILTPLTSRLGIRHPILSAPMDGIAGARLLTRLIGWPTIISSQAVAVAFLFSLAVGIFFGLYPANKASRMNPNEALDYE